MKYSEVIKKIKDIAIATLLCDKTSLLARYSYNLTIIDNLDYYLPVSAFT